MGFKFSLFTVEWAPKSGLAFLGVLLVSMPGPVSAPRSLFGVDYMAFAYERFGLLTLTLFWALHISYDPKSPGSAWTMSLR